MSRYKCAIGVLLALSMGCSNAIAGAKSKTVREVAEYLLDRFGKEVGEETIDTLSARIERLAARFGDGGIEAVEKVGPRTFRIIEEAGENGERVVKLLAKYGDQAVWVVSRPDSMAIFVKHGEDSAQAMMRHKGIAEPLIKSFGNPAITALTGVSTQNARRLAMMADSGEIAKIGRTEEVLGVIGRYGDSAMEFVWKNKGALAVSAVLAAFIADPEPFLNGARDVTRVAADAAAKPITESARNTNWTLVFSLCIVAVMTVGAGRLWLGRRGKKIAS